MAKWCPSCGAEYIEGWGTCSQCGIALVDSKPRKAKRAPDFGPDDAIFIEPRAAREREDPFVPIWEGDTVEASRLARHLEAAAIPVDLGEALSPGESRVEIPRSYTEEAFIVLNEIGESPAPPPEPDLGDGLPAERGWSPGVRLALWTLAIAIIVGLLVTSRF